MEQINRKVTIVMYHYVREILESKYPRIKGLELEDFIVQLDYFQKEYQIITMEEVVKASKNPKISLPERSLLLTFDDGYLDHYRDVFPILKQRTLQGSFFVPTSILEKPMVLDVNKIHYILANTDPHDLLSRLFQLLDQARTEGYNIPSNEELFRLHAIPNRWDSKEILFIKRMLQSELLEQLRNQISSVLFQESMNVPEKEFAKELYMNLPMMQEMKSAGMYFGLHGAGHYHLGKLPIQKARLDMEESMNIMKSNDLLNQDCLVMNYPYGSYNEDTLQEARNVGCQIGLSVIPQVADLDQDLLMALPRFDTNDFYPKNRVILFDHVNGRCYN